MAVYTNVSFAEAAALQKPGERLVRCHVGCSDKLAQSDRQQMPGEVATRQRFAGLPKGIESRAAGDKDRLTGRATVGDTFEPVAPVFHLMKFVEDEQRRPGRPGLPQHHTAVGKNIPVEHLCARSARG